MLSLVLVSFGLIALIWIGLRHAGGASPDSSAVALSLAGRVVVDSVGMRCIDVDVGGQNKKRTAGWSGKVRQGTLRS